MEDSISTSKPNTCTTATTTAAATFIPGTSWACRSTGCASELRVSAPGSTAANATSAWSIRRLHDRQVQDCRLLVQSRIERAGNRHYDRRRFLSAAAAPQAGLVSIAPCAAMLGANERSLVGIARALIFGGHHPCDAISIPIDLLALPVDSAEWLGTRIVPLLTTLLGNAHALVDINPWTLKHVFQTSADSSVGTATPVAIHLPRSNPSLAHAAGHRHAGDCNQ